MEFSKLFVVFDPTKDQQPALDRAVAISKERDVALHIYACIYSDISNSADQAKEIKAQVFEQQAKLDAIVESLGLTEGNVKTEVEWHKDWYRTVVQASIRNQADVVLKSSYKHVHHQRILNKSSDWTLIRECLCPVMLVKEGSNDASNSKRVLAAIDGRAKEGAHATLNEHIIALSKKVLKSKDADVHFISAYQDSLEYPDRGVLVRSCGVDNDRIHIKQGSPDKVIVEGAKSLDVGMVVIGSSGRKGLSAMVHGNTAEKILDDLDCCVLSVP